jgi:hypothetical protein
MNTLEKLCLDSGLGCTAVGAALWLWFQAAIGVFMLCGGAALLGMRLWLTWREVQEKRAKKNAPE